MAHKELLNSIISLRKMGLQEGQIISYQLQRGYSRRDIDDAIRTIDQDKIPTHSINRVNKKKYFIIGAIVIFLLVVVISLFYFSNFIGKQNSISAAKNISSSLQSALDVSRNKGLYVPFLSLRTNLPREVFTQMPVENFVVIYKNNVEEFYIYPFISGTDVQKEYSLSQTPTIVTKRAHIRVWKNGTVYMADYKPLPFSVFSVNVTNETEKDIMQFFNGMYYDTETQDDKDYAQIVGKKFLEKEKLQSSNLLENYTRWISLLSDDSQKAINVSISLLEKHYGDTSLKLTKHEHIQLLNCAEHINAIALANLPSPSNEEKKYLVDESREITLLDYRAELMKTLFTQQGMLDVDGILAGVIVSFKEDSAEYCVGLDVPDKYKTSSIQNVSIGVIKE